MTALGTARMYQCQMMAQQAGMAGLPAGYGLQQQLTGYPQEYFRWSSTPAKRKLTLREELQEETDNWLK